MVNIYIHRHIPHLITGKEDFSACELTCFEPKTGLASPGIEIAGGAGVQLALPPFHHDIAIRIPGCNYWP